MRTDGAPLAALLELFGAAIEDADGKSLLGKAAGDSRAAVLLDGTPLGNVVGLAEHVAAAAALVSHLAAKESERRSLANEVLHLYREVHLIDQLSEELTALFDAGAAAHSALTQAARLVQSMASGIFVRRAEGEELACAAHTGDLAALPAKESGFLEEVLVRGAASIVNAGEMASGGGLRNLLFAPLRAKQRIVGVIVLVNDGSRPYSAADLKLLNTIALQTAAAIENSMLCAEMVEAARSREQLTALQRELETARAIQHSLVPRTFPPFPDRKEFELHAQMLSARAVGGDFFNFFLLDEEHLALVIGDVSGKGTASALFMAVAHTHLRTVAAKNGEPAECMAEVNRILLADKASSMYATCFYAILNTRTGELRFSNAGHNPPYLVRGDGAVEELPQDGGPPLGLFAGVYAGGVTALQPGDTLYLYTDGVPEAMNADEEDYGDETLAAALRELSSHSPRELIADVHARISAFVGDAPQSDDITMIALKRASVQPA